MNASVRQRIVKSAIRLFSERGYNGATMEQIASSARCSEDVLHENFRHKADLYYQSLVAVDSISPAMDSVVNILREESDLSTAAQKIHKVMEKSLTRDFVRLRLFSLLERKDISRRFFDFAVQPFYAALAARMRQERVRGTLRPGTDPDIATMQFFFAVTYCRIIAQIAPVDGMKKLGRRDKSDFINHWLLGIVAEKSEISTV